MPTRDPLAKRITKNTIAAAVKDSAEGLSYDKVDPESSGLQLRVKPSGVRWSFRGRLKREQRRYDLGSATSILPEEARDIARKVRDDLRNDRDPTETINELVKGIVPDVKPMRIRTWTWAQAVEAFLKSVQYPARRKATFGDYRRALQNTPEFQHLKTRHIVDITAPEMSKIIQTIANRRHSVADHNLRIIKSMWSWLSNANQQDESGITVNIMKMVTAPEQHRHEVGSNDELPDRAPYLPPIEEIARIICICRSGVISVQVANAIMLMIYTAQRRRTVVSARIQDFDIDKMIWKIPPYFRKTGKSSRSKRPHIVPITEPVLEIFNEQYKTYKGANALFGLLKRPTKITTGSQSNMNESVLNHAFSSFPNVEASPHDVRRAFKSFCSKNGYDSDLIMHHMEGVKEDDTGGLYYELDPKIEQKAVILSHWANAIEIEADLIRHNFIDLDKLKATIKQLRYKHNQ